MVSFEIVQQSNALIPNLPKGLVALFIGATAGIGESSLQQFAEHAPSPRIYTVARPSAVPSHETLLASLRETNPTGTYNLIPADISLISEVDRVVEIIKQRETKLDLLFMSPGFIAFEGRKNTSEGLDPSMTTRYYSRQRAVEQLLPLLNNVAAISPRIISVLAAGMERPMLESDLDLREPQDWTPMGASFHVATMSTLSLERVAQENPRLSIAHWLPGVVATRGLARIKTFGISPPNERSQEEAGARGAFLATSDRYAVQGGLVSVPEGLEILGKSDGGIFRVDPDGESSGDEDALNDMRKRGVDKLVWNFTQQIFADCVN